MSEATNGRLIGPTLLLSVALNEHDIKALNDYTTWWRAQLARAEKVIEAATVVLMWWDDPTPHQPKPNVPTGRAPMEALRLALAEYDCPSRRER